MSIKNDLRQKIKEERKHIENKSIIAKEVSNKLLSSKLYSNTEAILCYASLDDEISTDFIIENALKDGKIVALPVCQNTDGDMEFYIIKSFDDLTFGYFNVREPDISKCKRLEKFDSSVIIVPALCYDVNGYRLGYGKGYYDKYLQKNNLISIGLCYNTLIVDNIPKCDYDEPVDYIITESQFIQCDNGGQNGQFRI